MNESKLKLLNDITIEAKPHLINYWKAIKELQSKPYNPRGDQDVLIKYHLIDDYWQGYNPKNVAWSYDLKQLNIRYKEILKLEI